MKEILQNIAQRGTKNIPNHHPSYVGKDGLLYCQNCHTPKQVRISLGEQEFVMPAMCECVNQDYYEKEAHRRTQERIQELRSLGITDQTYHHYTFTQDDGSQPKFTNTCKKYVENWEEMVESNIGILFTGAVGSGKTFLAGCIGNALIEQGHSVCMTSMPKMINQINDTFAGKQERVERYNKFELLILDDLGADRNSDFTSETIFHVIDNRYRVGKPLIVTTNATLEEMEHPKTVMEQRIFDRVLEMCPIHLNLTVGRRNQKREIKRQHAKMLFTS